MYRDAGAVAINVDSDRASQRAAALDAVLNGGLALRLLPWNGFAS